MILHRLFFPIVFMLVPYCIFAQENPLEKNEQDKIYTPDKNSVFNTAGNTSDKSSEISEIKNAIKFNPSLLVRSMAVLFYERNITSGITVQGGAGTCFNTDKVMGVAAEAEIILSSPQSTIPLYYIMSNGKFVSGGNLSASFRFYYSNYYSSYESFNSSYFEIGMRYYSNNIRLDNNVPAVYSSYSSSDYLTTGGTVSIRNYLYQLNYGYQLYTQGKVKTTHDFYIGFGIKNVSYNMFKQEDQYLIDQYGNYQTIQVNVKSASRESVIMPAILFGYVFGFGF